MASRFGEFRVLVVSGEQFLECRQAALRVGARGLRLERIFGTPLIVALAALVVFNGLTPYLELKTGYGFNMYANLATTDGVSNHLIIRRTLPLTDVQAHLAQVESSDDPVLSRYATDGYLLPERNLRDYLASHPSARAVVTVEGRRMEVSGADFGRPLPVLVRKFQLFRAVDRADPPRCQLGWLPAA